MPEGPEIRRARDQVARVLEGRTLLRVTANWPALVSYQQEWVGLTVQRVDTRGKALLTQLSNGDLLYSHNQLYGRWMTRRDGREPSSSRSLRLGLVTDAGGAFLYSATDLEVLNENDLSAHPYLASLGPDLLARELTAEQLAARLTERAFRNRQLGSLYLDQGFLAGPGNYLRSEILFCAGVHPKAKPSQLTLEQLQALAEATLSVGWRAYRQQGVTVTQETAQALKAAGQRKRQYRHYVFRRADQLCRCCGEGPIVRLKQAGRDLFYCPRCQPGP